MYSLTHESHVLLLLGSVHCAPLPLLMVVGKFLPMSTQGSKCALFSLDPCASGEISSYMELNSCGDESLHEPTWRTRWMAPYIDALPQERMNPSCGAFSLGYHQTLITAWPFWWRAVVLHWLSLLLRSGWELLFMCYLFSMCLLLYWTVCEYLVNFFFFFCWVVFFLLELCAREGLLHTAWLLFLNDMLCQCFLLVVCSLSLNSVNDLLDTWSFFDRFYFLVMNSFLPLHKVTEVLDVLESTFFYILGPDPFS